MKSTTFASLLAAVVPLASAHYTFDVLMVDGQETGRGDQYIRPNTRRERYMPTKFVNSFDGVTPTTDDFRCNLGAGTSGNTQVIEVAAGTKIGAKLAFGATMQHPGPALVYMSRAPNDDVLSYDGSGDWFKIFQEGICRDTDVTTDAWCTWDRNTIDAVIPEDTPAGEYLVRFEHVGLHGAHDGQAEFYYSCAQVRVTGNGSGTPGPMVQFPGAYGQQDESWNFSVWGGNHNFPFPQPAVWEGGNAGGSSPAPPEPPVEEEDEVPEATPAPSTTAAPTPTLAPTPTFVPVTTETPAPAPPAASQAPVDDNEACRARFEARRARRAARRARRSRVLRA